MVHFPLLIANIMDYSQWFTFCWPYSEDDTIESGPQTIDHGMDHRVYMANEKCTMDE